MILKLHSRESSRIIKVDKSFFENTKVKQAKNLVTVTPFDKSEQLGRDCFGRDYIGHILEKDGEVISNTLGNRDLKVSPSILDVVNVRPGPEKVLSFRN